MYHKLVIDETIATMLEKRVEEGWNFNIHVYKEDGHVGSTIYAFAGDFENQDSILTEFDPKTNTGFSEVSGNRWWDALEDAISDIEYQIKHVEPGAERVEHFDIEVELEIDPTNGFDIIRRILDRVEVIFNKLFGKK